MNRDLSGQQVTERWARSVSSNSKQNYMDGVSATTENPMAKAADRADYWFQQVQEAHSQNRFATRLRAAGGIENWKNPSLNKGANRIVQGSLDAKPKYMKAMDRLMPVLNAAKKEIAQMPKGGKANAMARVEKMLDTLYAFKASR